MKTASFFDFSDVVTHEIVLENSSIRLFVRREDLIHRFVLVELFPTILRRLRMQENGLVLKLLE